MDRAGPGGYRNIGRTTTPASPLPVFINRYAATSNGGAAAGAAAAIVYLTFHLRCFRRHTYTGSEYYQHILEHAPNKKCSTYSWQHTERIQHHIH